MRTRNLKHIPRNIRTKPARKPKPKVRVVKRRTDTNHTSEHHRKPSSLDGETIPENISTVSIKKHQAWHLLFRNHAPEKIAEIINKVWLDPAFEFLVIPRRKKIRR